MLEQHTKIIPGLTEEKIVRLSQREVFKRGHSYFQHGSIVQVMQSGETIVALVCGSQQRDYTVKIEFDGTAIKKVHCSCPYKDDPYCKHIVAVLLCCIHTPDKVLTSKELTLKLDNLTLSQLKELITTLILSTPKILNEMVLHLETISHVSGSSDSTLLVNPEYYQNEAEKLLDEIITNSNSGYHGYGANDYESDIIDQLCALIAEAKKFLSINDTKNSMIILESITESYIDQWNNLCGTDGLTGEFFSYLDDAWTEAILRAQLGNNDLTDLESTIEDWTADANEYGADDAFFITRQALQQGWDGPEIKPILSGNYEQPRERGKYSIPELAKIRLTILEHHKRFTEYEHLAYYEGLAYELVHILIVQEHIEEAVKKAKKILKTTEDALTITQELFTAGHSEPAFAIASLGLTLSGSKIPLAAWLSNTADSLGNTPLEHKALMIAFKEKPTLERYQRILSISNPHEKAAIQDELITFIRQKKYKHYSSTFNEALDIFLHAGLLDDATHLIESHDKAYISSIEKVMKVVVHKKPQWGIALGITRANEILANGTHSDYDDVISWLTFVKDAYESTNNKQGWHMHISTIRATHKTKRKFIRMLEEAFGS